MMVEDVVNRKLTFMKKAFIIFIILFTANTWFNSAQTLSFTTLKVDHYKWNELLQNLVDEDGNVDYKEFYKDQITLSNYLVYLSQNSPDESWSKSEALVYYINLYNAATVQLILKNYPLNSIKDIESPWKQPFIKLGEDFVSLGDIEHKYLRKFNEPRIHFAINCASISCPKLLNEAFTILKLEDQLEKVTIQFINGPKNTITSDRIVLSKIFKWYKKDFIKTQKLSLQDYIKRYSTVTISPKATIQFMEYDWGLNDTSN